MKKLFFSLIMMLVCINLIGISSALVITSASTNPSEVAPGQTFNLYINLENNLDDTVEDVTLSLDLSQVPISPVDSSDDYVDEIEEGDKESFSMKLIASSDAEAGIYKFPILISYILNDEEKTRKSVLSVTINSKPNLEMSSESVLIKNQKNKLELKITNTGLAKAKFLDIKMLPSSYFDVLSSQKVYIGDLESDDFDSVNFEVFTKEQSVFSIPIEVNYRDSTNRGYTETIYLNVKAYSLKEAQDMGLVVKSNAGVYFIILLVLFVFWFGYRWLKKRKRKNKSPSD